MEDPVNETLSAQLYVGTRFAVTDWAIIEAVQITQDEFAGDANYRDFHVDFSLPSTTTLVEFRLDYLGGTGDLLADSINWE